MEKLFKSLIEKEETDELVKEEFLRNKLASINALEMTANELMTLAEEGGWASWLRELSLAEFSRLLSEPAPFSSESGFEHRGNLSPNKEEKPVQAITTPKEIDECIVDFLRTNPWSDAEVVASGIDLPLNVIEKKLREILAQNHVKAVETGDQTRFALM